jgi:hypothetical protein
MAEVDGRLRLLENSCKQSDFVHERNSTLVS